MERKIGERFTFNGVMLEVEEVKTSLCTGCYLHKERILNSYSRSSNDVGVCFASHRTDGKYVIFRKVEE